MTRRIYCRRTISTIGVRERVYSAKALWEGGSFSLLLRYDSACGCEFRLIRAQDRQSHLLRNQGTRKLRREEWESVSKRKRDVYREARDKRVYDVVNKSIRYPLCIHGCLPISYLVDAIQHICWMDKRESNQVWYTNMRHLFRMKRQDESLCGED